MIGVRFTKPVSPYGAGDKAMLPEAVAQRLIDDGEAELHRFPDAPHAHAEGEAAPAVTEQPRQAGFFSASQMRPARGKRHGYSTK